MIASADLDLIARQVQSAQDEARQIEPITATRDDFDISAAYAVSERIHRARLAAGATAVGRKIGFTNPDMWLRYGVDAPIWAHVYDTTVVRSSDGMVRCSLARFCEPKIEPEIVLHFATTPLPDSDLAGVLACIDWVAPAFEIVQSHFPGWQFQAPDTIADSGLHGTLLLGEPQAVERLGPGLADQLVSLTLALSCNGAVLDTGRGANVLGSPLAALFHLLTVLNAQGAAPPLQAGEMVTTGTITAAHPVRAGETWRCELTRIALPALSVKFVE